MEECAWFGRLCGQNEEKVLPSQKKKKGIAVFSCRKSPSQMISMWELLVKLMNMS